MQTMSCLSSRRFATAVALLALGLALAACAGTPAASVPEPAAPASPANVPTAGAAPSATFTSPPTTTPEGTGTGAPEQTVNVKANSDVNKATDAGTVEPGLEALVRLAGEDLAKRTGTPTTEIQLLEARTITWPDAGLGCPQPGMAYAQVQVDGVLIRLRANGREYEYHSGGGRAPFLCQK
jgi:hypothetical protein